MSKEIEINCIDCTFGKGKIGETCPVRLVEIFEHGKCLFGGRLSRIGKKESRNNGNEKKERINFFDIDKPDDPEVDCPGSIKPIPLESCFDCKYCIGFVEMKIACNRASRFNSNLFK